MLMSWAESIGLYPGNLEYLEPCDFGRYAMLTHPNTDDTDRLYLVGQSMIALFAMDDYYVDDKRSGATLEQVRRNLSLCMSALDVPFLTDKYGDDTTRGIEADPVLVSLRQYIDRTAKYGTPQRVTWVRLEDLALFVAMRREGSWLIEKRSPFVFPNYRAPAPWHEQNGLKPGATPQGWVVEPQAPGDYTRHIRDHLAMSDSQAGRIRSAPDLRQQFLEQLLQ